MAPLKTINLTFTRPQSVRLLLPQISVESKDWRQDRGLSFHVDDDAAFQTLHWVLERGEEYEADVIIFPELAVPETKIPLLQEWSLTTNSVVIGGSHYHEEDGHWLSRSPIIIKGASR